MTRHAAAPKGTFIVFDFVLMRPACALLQAALGGDTGAFQRHFGGRGNWLLAPTPGMKLWRGTDEEWAGVASVYERKNP